MASVAQRRLFAADARGVPAPAGQVIAEDPRSLQLLDLARRVARSNATVLLDGPTGCGKEVIARYIHAHSGRESYPFVAINCAAIPDSLLEATLFGSERGAFTGAVRAMPGKFEQAQHGTLLLDEISEMPLSLQAKLLRVLQEREVERVGGNTAIALDVRIIATSNRDVAMLAAQGAFREDLYYRLSAFPLHLAPLRQRPGDILALAGASLARLCEEVAIAPPALSPAAARRLMHHHWPGNVRELQNVMQRALILADGAGIDVEHLGLPAPMQNQAVTPFATEKFPPDMKTLERTHILETLAAVNGSRKMAVRQLGISERTLRYKLRQYRAEAMN